MICIFGERAESIGEKLISSVFFKFQNNITDNLINYRDASFKK
ncbi:hypothetical protein [Chryseobacterium sp. T20]